MLKKCLVLILLLTCLTGCHAYYRTKFMGKRINIIDLATQEAVTIPYTGGIYPPTIESVSMDGKSFFNLFLKDKDLELEKIGVQGEILSSQQIPFYSVYFGARPYNCYVSPDESKVAYIRHHPNNLYCYDLGTRKEQLIYEKLFSNPYSVEGMFWANNRTLVVILRDEIYSGIIKIDVKKKKVLFRYPMDELNEYAYAPKSGILAVGQMIRGGGVKFIDINSMKLVDEIKAPDSRSWVKKIAWNPSESLISYVYGGRGPEIYTYSLKEQNLTHLTSLTKKTVVYSLDHLDEHTIAFRYGYPDNEQIDKTILHMINLKSKLDIVLPLPGFYSDITILDGGKKVTYVAR